MLATQPKPGARVRLSRGYDMDPEWLGGQPFVTGTLRRFIPGQNDQPAAVVELDQTLTSPRGTGMFAVLELRYVGQTWEGSGTVHVELCTDIPPDQRWQDRAKGAWVESHAAYKLF